MSSTIPIILSFLATSVSAGLLGVAALEATMWLASRGLDTRANMVVAIGSLLTRSRNNAFLVGAFVHATAAIVFSTIYALLMLAAGFNSLPGSLMLGLGIGIMHGILVSLMLVWIVSDTHPLEEFRNASLSVGLSHLAGHVAFGAMVGIVVGVSPI